ncbi:MAG: 50S ribosomal protein L29 [Planctomycetota bacterium]
MKIRELRQKEDKELLYDLKTLRKELFDLRFQAASKAVQSPAKIRTTRRTIARIFTILKERDQGVRGAKHF